MRTRSNALTPRPRARPVDRLEHAATSRVKPRAAAGRRHPHPIVQTPRRLAVHPGVGPDHLSSQRMCWLARAKNWRTFPGRASRMALSSRSTTALKQCRHLQISTADVSNGDNSGQQAAHSKCSRWTDRSSNARHDSASAGESSAQLLQERFGPRRLVCSFAHRATSGLGVWSGDDFTTMRPPSKRYSPIHRFRDGGLSSPGGEPRPC